MANAQESALLYVFGDTLPAHGTTLEVAPGVRWLRMALPFALDHINLWLLRDRLDGTDGWTIVDCGISNDSTRAHWEQIFASAELQGLPVLRVIVTHMHPDHMGLAHWLCQRWSTAQRACRLWISATDWFAARAASAPDTLGESSGGRGDNAARFFALHGLNDAGALDKVRGRSGYYAAMVPQVPAHYRRLLDGMQLRIGGHDWQCHVGYGHAPEHMALHNAALGVLIAGDMVLPRISTNVSVHESEPEADALRLYLDSITRMRVLPADTLVLPSHGKPFTGLHERIAQLLAHHDDRFADVLQACAEQAQSAADMLPVLFRRTLDAHQTTFAMGEAIAHMHALASTGQLLSVLGADGVQRFRTVG